MSVWTDSSEVLFTTSKALTVLDAKYLSADPQKFDVAQFTMTNDLTNINPLHKPINPTQYTTLPPIYLDEAALDAELEQHHELYTRQALPPDWYADYHFSITDTNDQSQAEAMCQYVFVLDALNFCFWPLPGYEYEHLASSLKDTFIANPAAFSAEALSQITPEQLTQYLQPNLTKWPLISTTAQPAAQVDSTTGLLAIPLLHARVRLVRELGTVLAQHFDGLAYNVVARANYSAKTLVRLLTQYFPGFRDNSQFAGDQIFFYKRVQILCGDLFGAFRGQGIAAFTDMDFLTCFPDYRIPQLFRSLGILRVTPEVEQILDRAIVDSSPAQNIPPNCEEEILIRCWTVQTVELFKHKLATKFNTSIHAYQLDWLLWERGEKLMKDNQIVPHHRTLTTYY